MVERTQISCLDADIFREGHTKEGDVPGRSLLEWEIHKRFLAIGELLTAGKLLSR